MSGRVLLGWTSTKQGLMCLTQGHNAAMHVRLEPTTSQSWDKHSTTESLRCNIRSRLGSSWFLELSMMTFISWTCIGGSWGDERVRIPYPGKLQVALGLLQETMGPFRSGDLYGYLWYTMMTKRKQRSQDQTDWIFYICPWTCNSCAQGCIVFLWLDCTLENPVVRAPGGNFWIRPWTYIG